MMLVDESPIEEKLLFIDIAHGNHKEEDKLDLVNVDTPTDPSY